MSTVSVKQEPSSPATPQPLSPSPSLSPAPPSADPMADKTRSPADEPCVPSFIQTQDGGLVAGSVVPSGTVLGPYPGSVTKATTRNAEQEDEMKSTVLKIRDATGQAYLIDVTQSETERPWWSSIKQTTDQTKANITLLSHDGALCLKTLKTIAQSEELKMILTTPDEGGAVGKDVAGDNKATPDKDVTPIATPSKHPPSTNLSKGPRFKCNFCCIEFRNPCNLEAHCVYYCPGTATKPLPSTRRCPAPPVPSPVVNAPATKGAPTPEASCPSVPSSSSEKAPARQTLKTLVCQLCQSSFESKSNCESHMLLLHCDEFANLCKFCNFIARSHSGLCQHVFSHVREVMVELPDDSGVAADKTGHSHGTDLVGKLPEDDGDEKENRYDVAAAGSTGNNPQHVTLQPATSPCVLRITDSPGDQTSKHRPVRLASPESGRTRTHIKEERANSVQGSSKVHGLAARPSQETAEEDIVSCPQCDFVTSQESVLLKHVARHHNAQEKSPAEAPSADIQAPEVDKRQAIPNHLDTKCHQCNIVFMSKKNYAAHKQYYCASRHLDTVSTAVNVEAKSKATSAVSNRSINTSQIDNNATKSSKSPDEPQRSSSRIVSPCSSPVSASRSNSPRNGHHPKTQRVTAPASTSLASPSSARASPHSQPPWMIHVNDSRPHYPPSAKVLPGSQLVLITPIVVPQGVSNPPKVDPQRKVLAVRSSKGEQQPLDLSTKPKTPPLSDLSGSSNHQGTNSSGLTYQIAAACFPKRPSFRCEECEISFTKNESLVVHKQYYCASRHMYTPRGLVRTKQYGAAKAQRSQVEPARPEQAIRQSPCSQSDTGSAANHSPQTNPKISQRSSPSPNPSSIEQASAAMPSDIPGSAQEEPSVASTSLSQRNSPDPPSLSNGHSLTKQTSLSSAEGKDATNPWPLSVKRPASNGCSEADREKSLPPIKRKRNLFLESESRIPSTETSTKSRVSNGVIIKQEPREYPVSACPYTCSRPAGVMGFLPTSQSQHSSPKIRSRSSSPSLRSKHSPSAPTRAVIKQEPRDNDASPMTNGHSRDSDPHQSAARSHRAGSQQDAPATTTMRTGGSILVSPPAAVQPAAAAAAAVPLSIPVYRHLPSRPSQPPRHMTVSSYLNTGTSRPLLRGVKPTVKHCRNCNISFSSLSTFIAHKKYYCASHHQAKNTAT